MRRSLSLLVLASAVCSGLYTGVASAAPRISAAKNCAVVGIVARAQYLKSSERSCFTGTKQLKRSKFVRFTERVSRTTLRSLKKTKAQDPSVCTLVGIKPLKRYMVRSQRWCFTSERAAQKAGFKPFSVGTTGFGTPTPTPTTGNNPPPNSTATPTPTPTAPGGARSVSVTLQPTNPPSTATGSCTGTVSNGVMHLHCTDNQPGSPSVHVHVNDAGNAIVCRVNSPGADFTFDCPLGANGQAALDGQFLVIYVLDPADQLASPDDEGQTILSGPIV